MSGIRIIGIGSPFGDDRIGWEVIDAIERGGMIAGLPSGTVTALRCSQPATDLLPMMSGADAVFLIDGVKSGAAPGVLRKVDISELCAENGKLSSHGLGVQESLALARALGLLPQAIVIYGVEIGEVGPEQGISREVLAAIPLLLREIETDLRTLVNEND